MNRLFFTAALVALVFVLSCSDKKEYSIEGEHQAGILTPAQSFVSFVVFDLKTNDAGAVKALFQRWSLLSASFLKQKSLAEPSTDNVPTVNTGEALDLDPSNLTITFGVGPSFFDVRYGWASKKPALLKPLPNFPGDSLTAAQNGGDICVQVCSDDVQTAYAVVHALARTAKGDAVARWVQNGFSAAKRTSGTARNLQGFKDGTDNHQSETKETVDSFVWVGEESDQPWLKGGSFLVVRKIRMFVEVWDRSSLADQEQSIGRHKFSGAPLGQKAERDPVPDTIPADSHVRLARGSESILRRGFNYANGLDPLTGQWDSGLLFIGFQRNPEKQFIPIQKRLSEKDRLNEYIVTVGSGIFACFPGARPGGYVGDSFFEEGTSK